MSRHLDFRSPMDRAMRGVVRDLLAQIQQIGEMPGDHRLIVAFDTQHPDVEMADHLSDRYPGEMTIILQNWFQNLDVSEDGFAVTLSFGNVPEPLYIPFDAVKTFADPSVEFGYHFNAVESDDEEVKLPGEAPMEEDAEDEPEARHDAEVVSLDKFRK